MSLPSLAVIDECEYIEWVLTGSPTRLEGETSCAALMAHNGGAASLQAFIAGLRDSKEVRRTDEQRRPPQCAFLGYARYLSPDGRYEREICQESHGGFWRNPVITKSVENNFSVANGRRIGTVVEPVTSIESRFAWLDGTGYLLVVEGGTRLMAYRITD